MAYSMTQTIWQSSKEEIQEMMAVWPDIVCDVMEMTKNLNISEVAKWIEKVLQYNVPEGKKIRSLMLIYSYKFLASNDQLTEDNNRLIRILAWCVELMQAYVLIIDDIQDQSLLRRGKPCWYRYNNINEVAIIDGVMLEGAIYYIIQKHFKGKEYYVNLIEAFQDIIFKILMGQCLDMLSTNFSKKPNLDLFTMDRYDSLAKCKTAYYTYVFPIIIAMHFIGIKNSEMFAQAKTILLEIGLLYQVQDDYLACFEDSKIFGKDNTDIKEGKCTWLIVKALQRANPEQRKMLEECYGVSDPEKVKRVKQLFIDLDLPDAYFKYEKTMYDLLNANIQQISCDLPHDIFQGLLEKIYRRTS